MLIKTVLQEAHCKPHIPDWRCTAFNGSKAMVLGCGAKDFDSRDLPSRSMHYYAIHVCCMYMYRLIGLYV